MSETDGGETETFTITGPDGDEQQVALPAGLAGVFAEDGESDTVVAADFLVQAFAQQTHAVVHHSQEDTPELDAMDDHMAEIFEERFGVSLSEAMHG
jgi:hypothetical protein